MDPRFACIFVPDFPVEAVVRPEPDLREQPVAVLEGAAPLLRVVAANGKARALGIEMGMTRLQAEALPDVLLRRRSFLQEDAAHAALLDCAAAFSPRVEATAADTALLDLAGLERLFGPAQKITRDLARRASELGLETNVAVASNPDAALHAARRFPGVTLIPHNKEAERLGDLPLDVLAPAPEMLEILDRWGVRTFRALVALPEVAISERLGQEGLRLQKLARGAGSRPLVAAQPPLNFEEAIELEHPLELLEPLAFLLGRMLEQLCSRLSSRALATNELRLRLQLEHQEETFERNLRLPVPMQDARLFLKLLQLDLKSHPPDAPVVKLWLAAEPAPPRFAQNGLFLPLSPEPQKLELTLARISGIVGNGRAGSPELLDSHRPGAFRMVRFHPPLPGRTKISTTNGDLTMALRIFRPPLLASIDVQNGCPAKISCKSGQGLQGQIVWAAGPWRASGDWWGEGNWMRDEWDIAVRQENELALYRLVRELITGKWFLEGNYD